MYSNFQTTSYYNNHKMMYVGILLAITCFVTVLTSPFHEWKKTITSMNERMCKVPQSLSYPLVEFAEVERIEPILGYEELRNVSY